LKDAGEVMEVTERVAVEGAAAEGATAERTVVGRAVAEMVALGTAAERMDAEASVVGGMGAVAKVVVRVVDVEGGREEASRAAVSTAAMATVEEQVTAASTVVEGSAVHKRSSRHNSDDVWCMRHTPSTLRRRNGMGQVAAVTASAMGTRA
jgi:hypothetical protein